MNNFDFMKALELAYRAQEQGRADLVEKIEDAVYATDNLNNYYLFIRLINGPKRAEFVRKLETCQDTDLCCRVAKNVKDITM